MDLKEARAGGEKHRPRKRLGRGPGSGTGKTCGKGTKGQRSRSGFSSKPGFEGGQMPLFRRLPKRGFSNALFRKDYTIINVGQLEALEDGTNVTLDTILSKGLVSKSSELLKILGDGELTKKLNVSAQRFSASARKKIEAAGGTIVEI